MKPDTPASCSVSVRDKSDRSRPRSRVACGGSGRTREAYGCGVAAHASSNRGQAGVERLVGGEVTIKAVHLQRVHVDRVAELDRLHRTVPL
jgi:hypothetical protein